MEKELEKLFNELNRLAYEPEYHIYNVKEANQVIRRHFTKAFELRNSSLTLKEKHKKMFKIWKIYLDKTINNTYLINGKEYLESELVTVYKEIMDV